VSLSYWLTVGRQNCASASFDFIHGTGAPGVKKGVR